MRYPQNQQIIILDTATANKIAAGEIIEKPASIVKELIENSIDAGANNIVIHAKDGGISEIKVSDNGIGIKSEQVALAFQRHATSKIKSSDDLFSIRTYGFRGEALPSIAAIAKVSMLTKVHGEKIGCYYVIEGGFECIKEERACSEGTHIQVRDIFFNVPARKKHLKSMTRESANIVQVVSAMALGNPSIRFCYYHNDKLILQSRGNSILSDVVISILGPEMFNCFLPVEYADEIGLKIEGYISKPQYHRASKQDQYYYVNNRWIYSSVINKTLVRAYHTLVPNNRYPAAILNISIPLESVDVNVHPTKKEVKFNNEHYFESFLEAAFADTLKTRRSLFKQKNPDTNRMSTNVVKNNQIAFQWEKKSQQQKLLEAFSQNTIKEQIIVTEEYDAKLMSEEPIQDAVDKYPRLQPLGQIDGAYLIAVSQGDKGFFIVDQHAAHERIYYEYFKETMKQQTDNTQLLIKPEIINLTPSQKEFIVDSIIELYNAGFIIEHFGDNSFLLRGVPINMGVKEGIDLILDIVDNYEPNREKFTREGLIRMAACKAAIKANKNLSHSEMADLLNKLAATELPYTCPHGRPTTIHITDKELIKRFYR
ncbi:MAG: DNA mismatch repair endonuclease MutL [Bacillota bacterium]